MAILLRVESVERKRTRTAAAERAYLTLFSARAMPRKIREYEAGTRRNGVAWMDDEALNGNAGRVYMKKRR
ncbi:hypothetical protein [Paraburkholderia sp.]|uniref:hypothetical protein n=1 Tax=Paraburkholderia sp. TaxID=1926495 RepID=UPI0039E569C7